MSGWLAVVVGNVAKLRMKSAVFDFPTHAGSIWGIDGDAYNPDRLLDYSYAGEI